jgi:hypothetical protein
VTTDGCQLHARRSAGTVGLSGSSTFKSASHHDRVSPHDRRMVVPRGQILDRPDHHAMHVMDSRIVRLRAGALRRRVEEGPELTAVMMQPGD